ncbi:MAG TPA: 50S ribosomal protein L19 [bacterium]|nr:50S ribosomal protein L19 [bacterium]
MGINKLIKISKYMADTEQIKTEIKPGMTVKVYEKIKEMDTKGKEKDRIQIFEGMVIALRSPHTASGTMTVRKISNGVGVEKIFPLNSPLIEKIVPTKQAQVRRAKLYYLRSYGKKMKEKKI